MDSRSCAIDKVEHFADRRQRYRLQKQLAQSGRGDVYLAVDTFLDKVVALKILKLKATTGNVRQQLEQEARLCAALQSEHIVQISDYGITPDDQPFYVTDYLTGQTLKDILQQAKYLSVEQAVHIVTQICTCLQGAHCGVLLQGKGEQTVKSVKMIHRSLNPTNIFLLQTATGEQVKVLGFDITRVLDTQLQYDNPSLINRPSAYRYLAPEQFTGQQELDSWTDIYSLGILLYEMLSGVDPFFGLDGQASNVATMVWMKAHVSIDPVPLRSRSRCQNLSPTLEAIVMCCLQKSPSDRFNSVDHLSKALQVFLNSSGLPLSQSSTTPIEPAARSQVIEAISSPLGSAIPPHVKGSLGSALKTTITTADQEPSTPKRQAHAIPSSAKVSESPFGDLLTLSQFEIQWLNARLSQFIGPIAPLVLQKALATQTSELQLIEYLVRTMPSNLQLQAREQLQSFFNLRLQTSVLTPHQFVVAQTPNWSESSSKTALTLTMELNQKLSILLTTEIGPIAPYMILKVLKQATTWQEFKQGLAMLIPGARRSLIEQQVTALLSDGLEQIL
jgi:serine/threonine-protein kinase